MDSQLASHGKSERTPAYLSHSSKSCKAGLEIKNKTPNILCCIDFTGDYSGEPHSHTGHSLMNDNYWLLQATLLKLFARPIPSAKPQSQHKQLLYQMVSAGSSKGRNETGVQSKSHDSVAENSQNK